IYRSVYHQSGMSSSDAEGASDASPSRRQKRWSGRLRTAGALLLLLAAAAGIDALGGRAEVWPVAAGRAGARGGRFRRGRRWGRCGGGGVGGAGGAGGEAPAELLTECETWVSAFSPATGRARRRWGR